jgi:hypothetical protein
MAECVTFHSPAYYIAAERFSDSSGTSALSHAPRIASFGGWQLMKFATVKRPSSSSKLLFKGGMPPLPRQSHLHSMIWEGRFRSFCCRLAEHQRTQVGDLSAGGLGYLGTRRDECRQWRCIWGHGVFGNTFHVFCPKLKPSRVNW